MTVVSATRLRVRSLVFLLPFILASNRSAKQAAAAAGFLVGQLIVDRGRVFWTVTMWTDEASMRAYRNSGAHAAVMPKIVEWCDEGATATWQQESDKLPDLEELAQRIIEAARFVKLPNASRAHAAGAGPMPPRPRAIQAIRAKPKKA